MPALDPIATYLRRTARTARKRAKVAAAKADAWGDIEACYADRLSASRVPFSQVLRDLLASLQDDPHGAEAKRVVAARRLVFQRAIAKAERFDAKAAAKAAKKHPRGKRGEEGVK